ncbi:MAG: hypothetical protein E4H23_07030 [Chrysiogenales bacterium]|nr:MAG: hypothetical protein E4H23_07030 [Chrysiogenales bacterium]
MNPTENGALGTDHVCRVCRTRIAEKSIPFYCAKSSEMRPGLVPIYSFSTPVCKACIEERTKRRMRNYWRVALAVFAVVFIAVFIAAWKFLESGKNQGQFQVALLIAGFAGGFILVLALIISTQACSSQFVAVQLAVKDSEAELKAAGYNGFWSIPPKNLTIR